MARGLKSVNRLNYIYDSGFALGGPIKKNKTFFFFLWDQQLERDRTQMRPIVLTDCARNGIFRYWEGYQSGNLNQVTKGLAKTIRAMADGSLDSQVGAPAI